MIGVGSGQLWATLLSLLRLADPLRSNVPGDLGN
jgi:hypothetical protein